MTKSWTVSGTGLLITREKAVIRLLESIKDRLAIFKRIQFLFTENKKDYSKRMVIIVLIMISGVISPVFYKLLIDHVLIGRNASMLVVICTGTFGMYVLKQLLQYLQLRVDNRLTISVFYQLRMRIWDIFLFSKHSFSSQYNVGNMKNMIEHDVSAVESFTNTQIIDFAMNLANALVMVVVLLVIDWRLSVLSVLMIPISFLITRRIGKRVEKKTEKYRREFGRYEGWLAETIRGWKDIKILNVESLPVKTFDSYWKHLSPIYLSRQLLMGLNDVIQSVNFDFIMHMNIYFIGGLVVFYSNMTVGVLLIFIAYFNKLTSSLNKLNTANIQLQSDKPLIANVLDILNTETVQRGQKKLKGSIEFDRVSFRYGKGQKYALQDVSFQADEFDRIAIIGKSGHGKSTIVKLLVGLDSPQSGKITINHENISDMPHQVLSANIGVVMQDFDLFNLSIKDNLTLVKPQATMEEIERACKIAHIHEYINGLPNQYDTMVGERGLKLSGGQRQRLGIARLILKLPNIVILDEATSAIDNITEKEIFKELQPLLENKTVFIIGHKKSSIQMANKVIIIENGRIVAFDTSTSENIRNNALYSSST
jgi:ABC-type bacteriocin/lantibiotic exporter with double-glycine peptidase domain